MPRDDQNGSTEQVDLSDIPRQKGFTFYGSVKIEQNSRSINAIATSSVTYSPPPDELLSTALDKWEQVSLEVQRRIWDVAQARKIALQEGTDVAMPQFERNYITGEI